MNVDVNGDDLEYEQFYDENCEDAKEDVLTDIIKDRKKINRFVRRHRLF